MPTRQSDTVRGEGEAYFHAVLPVALALGAVGGLDVLTMLSLDLNLADVFGSGVLEGGGISDVRNLGFALGRHFLRRDERLGDERADVLALDGVELADGDELEGRCDRGGGVHDGGLEVGCGPCCGGEEGRDDDGLHSGGVVCID